MPISIKRITDARSNFDFALGDVKTLLTLHDSLTGGGKGRPDRDLEVLKRSGVILAVTAWETFIEDILVEQFRDRVKRAKSPKDIEGPFNSVARAWLDRNKSKPTELARWALDGWKAILLQELSKEIGELNTPSSAKISDLFTRYLGEDITKDWCWPGVSAPAACRRLDALIRLRGGLVHRGRVHRGRELSEKASVRRHHVVNAIALLERLVERTEASLNDPFD